MGNCLKTQLKEVVNNSNLPFLKEFRIFNEATNETATFGTNALDIYVTKPVVMRSIDGSNCLRIAAGKATDTIPDSGYTNSIKLSAGGTPVVIANMDCEVIIEDKFLITNINCKGYISRNFGIDLGQLNYNSALDGIYAPGIKTKGVLDYKVNGNFKTLTIGIDNNRVAQQANIDVEKFPATLITSDLRNGINTHGNIDVWMNKIRENNDYPRQLYINGTSCTGTLDSYLNAISGKRSDTHNIVLCKGIKAGTRILGTSVYEISTSDNGATFVVSNVGTYTVSTGTWVYSE